MSLLTLAQFQQSLQLSDGAMLWLLKESRLKVSLNDSGIIMIDPSSAALADALQALSRTQHAKLEQQREVYSARFRSIISAVFDEIVEDAIAAVTHSSAAGAPANNLFHPEE